MLARLVLVARGFGGATLPICGPGERDGRAGIARRGTEMQRRPARILKEPQCDPAGMEIGLDLLRVRLGPVAADDLVGGLGVALIQELSRDQAAFGPPLVAVNQDLGVARHVGDQFRGFGGFLRAAQMLGLGEQIRGVAPQGRRNGVERRAGLAGFFRHSHAGLDQRRVFLARIAGGALRRCPVLLEEESFHPIAMVGLGEYAGEAFQNAFFEVAAEHVLAPGLAHELGRILFKSVGLEGEREGVFSDCADRPPRREKGAHGGRGLAAVEQGLLGAPPDLRPDRPFGVVAQDFDDPVEADRRAAADRDPFGQGAGGGVLHVAAHPVAAGDVAASIELDRLLQHREVDARRGGGGFARAGQSSIARRPKATSSTIAFAPVVERPISAMHAESPASALTPLRMR
jgi:hypothetical protein